MAVNLGSHSTVRRQLDLFGKVESRHEKTTESIRAIPPLFWIVE